MNTAKPLILLFDDDESVRAQMQSRLLDSGRARVELFANEPHEQSDEIVTYERMIERQLIDRLTDDPISLVVCDKELGRYSNYPGLSATVISAVARDLGIPFCQYSRQPYYSQREAAIYKSLARWDSEEITLSGEGVDDWAAEAVELLSGFEHIREQYPLLPADTKPSMALACIMGRKSAATRISLYGSGDQSILTEVLAFANDGTPDLISDKLKLRMPRILGNWLMLSVLRFPGLLVDEVAAASFLNIAVDDFKRRAIQEEFSVAKYNGPFSNVSKWWWREELESIYLDAGKDCGLDYIRSKDIKASPCLDRNGDPTGYFCMVTREPVGRERSRGDIAWFPAGADLARIRSDVFERINALVSI